jgi:hypothetical protein
MRFWPVSIVAAGVAFFVLAAIAGAAYTLGAGASIVSPGNNSPHALELESSAPAAFASTRFTVPAGTQVEDLDILATDFMVVEGDCQLGSPRFQIRVDMDDDGMSTAADRNIFVYLGDTPAFTNCDAVAGWQSSGNLLIVLNVDSTQVGGPFYGTIDDAIDEVGEKDVLFITLVHDPYDQTFHYDNVNIDGTIYTFDQPLDKDECKKGGWEDLTRADGSAFKNQGDCIQYVNTGK